MLAEAKPLLEKSGFPATAFVASGFVGDRREFWWEELEELLLGSRNGTPSRRRRTEWHGTLAAGRGLRDRGRRLYGRHFLRLRLLDPGTRRSALDELAASFPERRPPRPARVPLSPEELRKLAEGGLITVGAHTITHPVLESLPPSAQEHEIVGSKTELEELLGRPVTGFSYPYGGPGEYGAFAVAAVQRAGFEFACANVPGLVRRGTDVLQIPRFVVLDWDGDTFARRLEHWLSGQELDRRNLFRRKVRT